MGPNGYSYVQRRLIILSRLIRVFAERLNVRSLTAGLTIVKRRLQGVGIGVERIDGTSRGHDETTNHKRVYYTCLIGPDTGR